MGALNVEQEGIRGSPASIVAAAVLTVSENGRPAMALALAKASFGGAGPGVGVAPGVEVATGVPTVGVAVGVAAGGSDLFGIRVRMSAGWRSPPGLAEGL